MTRPASRALVTATNSTDGVSFGGSCPGAACTWYSQDVTTDTTTNCDPKTRTMGVDCSNKVNPTDFPCTPGNGVPWCAPGTAPVRSPCGIFSGGWGTNGRDMRDLRNKPYESWTAGGVMEVAFAITANHGGGYAYRLCPVSTNPDESEECFQKNHLSFHGNTTYVIGTNKTVLAEIPAVRMTKGTWPKGSMWSVNPIPMEKEYAPAPFPGAYGRGPFAWSLMDLVEVPSNLQSGHYALSWRWDAEQTKQVWSHCSDVQIVNPNKPETPAKSQQRPEQRANVCNGGSIGLDVNDCDAWVSFYDALDGANWPKSWSQGCGTVRLDPCGCADTWQKSIVCNSERNLMRITEIYLLGEEVKGQLPSSIGSLSALVSISLVGTKITGTIPDTIGDARALSMVWLDHNPTLGGEIPASFSKLKLTAFELHMSKFTGKLPALDYANIPDCTLNGLVFQCPLPPGAETCGAVCL